MHSSYVLSAHPRVFPLIYEVATAMPNHSTCHFVPQLVAGFVPVSTDYLTYISHFRSPKACFVGVALLTWPSIV